jgi:tetratricopeptide (TPR) repeat protein
MVSVAPKPTPLVRDAQAALERAQRDIERGRVAEGIDLLEQAVELDPQNVPARLMLGVAYARTRRVEQGLEHLEAAAALAPEAFAPECALGELYLRLGVPDQARPRLARALERASSAEERAYVQVLLKEDRLRERRRAPRPSFARPFWLLQRWRGVRG